MKDVILPVFVSHMGCPHQCVFCNQFKIAGAWEPPTFERLLRDALDWKASSGVTPELAFYGGSFTAIEEKLQLDLLLHAKVLKDQGFIHSIRLSTRPDALSDKTLVRLKAYSVDTIEIGMQSLCDEVLLASGRGHDAWTAKDAVRRVKEAGFKVGGQLMVGLPGDTPQRAIKSASALIALEPDFVRIYPTAVVRDTPLEALYRSGQYVPWEMDVCLDVVAEMLMLFDGAAIPVIRIGLQAEDNLSQGDVVAGLYHPALGEMVKARVYRKKMEALLRKKEKDEIVFAVGERMLSQAIGQHRANISYLEDKTGCKVSIMADKAIKGNAVERR